MRHHRWLCVGETLHCKTRLGRSVCWMTERGLSCLSHQCLSRANTFYRYWSHHIHIFKKPSETYTYIYIEHLCFLQNGWIKMKSTDFFPHQMFHRSLLDHKCLHHISLVMLKPFAVMRRSKEKQFKIPVKHRFFFFFFLKKKKKKNEGSNGLNQSINTNLNPLIVKETQEVKRRKVNALFSIDCNLVTGRSVM